MVEIKIFLDNNITKYMGDLQKEAGKKTKTRSLVEWMKLLYFPIAKPMK